MLILFPIFASVKKKKVHVDIIGLEYRLLCLFNRTYVEPQPYPVFLLLLDLRFHLSIYWAGKEMRATIFKKKDEAGVLIA